MQSLHNGKRSKSLQSMVLLATVVLCAACSMPAKQAQAPKKQAQAQKQIQPTRVDIQQDATGFTILEDVRVSADVRADYESAVRSLEHGQYEEGIAALLKVIETAPNVTAVHIDLGIAYARSANLDRAQESFEKALQLNPRHPIAYNELGMVYRRKGQFVKARASYEKALELFPSFHFAQRNLAILCDVYLGDLKCALQHYEAYRQSAPSDEQTAKWIADLNNRANR